MSTDKGRSYVSEKRKAQAQHTRARILASARALFQELGFEHVTIQQIAQGAHVSAPSVYAVFSSKKGVLMALMDEAVAPQEFDHLVQQARVAKTPQAHLRVTAKIARTLYDAERAQMDFLRGAQILAPELKAGEQEREARRHSRLQETMAFLVAHGALSKDHPREEIHDMLWALTGRDLYRMLVVERAWASQRYEAWLGSALMRELLDAPGDA